MHLSSCYCYLDYLYTDYYHTFIRNKLRGLCDNQSYSINITEFVTNCNFRNVSTNELGINIDEYFLIFLITYRFIYIHS